MIGISQLRGELILLLSPNLYGTRNVLTLDNIIILPLLRLYPFHHSDAASALSTHPPTHTPYNMWSKCKSHCYRNVSLSSSSSSPKEMASTKREKKILCQQHRRWWWWWRWQRLLCYAIHRALGQESHITASIVYPPSTLLRCCNISEQAFYQCTIHHTATNHHTSRRRRRRKSQRRRNGTPTTHSVTICNGWRIPPPTTTTFCEIFCVCWHFASILLASSNKGYSAHCL